MGVNLMNTDNLKIGVGFARRRVLQLLSAVISAGGQGADAEKPRALALPKTHNVRSADSVSALRALPGGEDGEMLLVKGYRFPGDGGGGEFIWDANGTESDDAAMTLAPDVRVAGRWKRIRSEHVNARWFGAKGDGQNDDAIALQTALTWTVSRGEHLIIPCGRYRISRPLYIGEDSEGRHGGFTISGSGMGQQEQGPGGTVIELDGTSHRAILIWKRSAWRRAILRDLSLIARNSDGSTFGLLWDNSRFSEHCVADVYIRNVTTAIGVQRGRDSNGEFTLFHNVHAWEVKNFFWSDAGQAFQPHFAQCVAFIRQGGVFFDISCSVVGGGFSADHFNGRCLSSADEPSNGTLIRLREKSNSPITLRGGRVEHLSRLIDRSIHPVKAALPTEACC
jgi:hypothetical protein